MFVMWRRALLSISSDVLYVRTSSPVESPWSTTRRKPITGPFLMTRTNTWTSPTMTPWRAKTTSSCSSTSDVIYTRLWRHRYQQLAARRWREVRLLGRPDVGLKWRIEKDNGYFFASRNTAKGGSESRRFANSHTSGVAYNWALWHRCKGVPTNIFWIGMQ